MTIHPDRLSYLRDSLVETSLLEVMVENMVEPVAIVDSDLILRAFNGAFLSDLSIAEPVGEVHISRLLPTLSEHIRPNGSGAFHLPEKFTLLHTPRPGQGAVHVQVRALPFGEGNHQHHGYVLLIQEPPASDQLYQQIRQLEHIIDRLRAQFVHLGSTELDQGIDMMLSQLGTFFQVDRSYLFQESLIQPGYLDNTHEWCAEGIEPQMDHLQRVPLDDDFTWLSRRLRAGNIVNYTDIDELPTEANRLRHMLAEQDIRSVLMVPFRFEDHRIGFVGFDAVRQTRVWTREVERLLRVLGEVIGPALQRQRAGLELERINQRYRDTVNLITDFIFFLTLNPQGDIHLEWAHGNVEIFGDLMPKMSSSQEELFKAIYPEDRPLARAGMETLGRGEVLHARLRLHWGDGQLRWIESISNPLLDEHGRLVGILSSVRDITDLRLAEQRVATQEQYLETVLETIPIAISLQDQAGRWLYANQQMIELYGIDVPYQQKSTEELVVPDRQHFALWEQLVSQEARRRAGPRRIAEQEHRLIDEQGQPRIYAMTRLHLTRQDEREEFVVTTCQDITLRREAEERTQHLANTLMQRNAELQQFAYITSHNLRAPVMNLVSLMGFYDRERPEAKTNADIIEKVDRSVHRLHETLNDLLEIVDIKDPEEASSCWQQVNDALAYVQQSIEGQLLRVGGVVHTDFQVEELYFSGPYLRSVLLNLLTNAIKYRSPDRPLRIWIRTERDEKGAVILSVRDNGIGIDLEKNRHRLFRMYERLQEQGEGRGLGLYMVRSQVEAMGGKVHVESALDVGTTFYLYFPHPKTSRFRI